MTNRNAQIRLIQTRLEKKRKEVLDDLTLEMHNGLAGPDRDTADPSDAASTCTEDTVIAEAVDLGSREIRKIEVALDKIRRKVYGLCEECGKRIKVSRLKALPFTPCCLECQSRLERERPEEAEEGAEVWESVQEPEA